MNATLIPDRCRDSDCGMPLVPEGPVPDIPDGFVEHQGRGLCKLCYFRHDRADTLFDFPRLTMSYDDTLTDWDILRPQGVTRRDAAAQIGISVAALDKAIERGIHAGDERAVWAPMSRHPAAIRVARRAVAERRRGWTCVLA